MEAITMCGSVGAESKKGLKGIDAERVRALVAGYVRRFGFTTAEADQVVDDILDAWNNFAFDPTKANRATRETVLGGFVVRECKAIMRKLVRSRARDTRYGEAQLTDKDDQPMRRDVPLRLDVQEALSRLSPQERAVCAALANDEPRQVICDRFDIGWFCLQGMIDDIRRRFAALGLYEWLEQ